MTVDVEGMFSDAPVADTYPGSKRKRRPPVERAPQPEKQGWDHQPLIKYMDGEPVEFFTIGALADALEKSPITLRRWERKGYIPEFPYRLPSHERGSTTMPGKRVLTRALIDATVEEFDKRGLLGAVRVEWNEHEDLTIALVERWHAITTA